MKWWNRVSCKIAALVLPVLLVAGLMPPVRAAAVDYVITGVVEKQLEGRDGLTEVYTSNGPTILLDASNFTWSGSAPTRITSNILVQNNISIGFSAASSEYALNRVSYTNGAHGVTGVVYLSNNVGQHDVKPYSGDVFLKINGVIVEGTRTSVSGYMIGSHVHVIPDYGNDVDLISTHVQEGSITYATGNFGNVDFYVIPADYDYDNDRESVSILLPSVSKGEVFTGSHTMIPDAADLAVFAAHPQILGVQRINVSDNLKRGKLQINGNPYHIYSEDLTYLGYMQPTDGYYSELQIDFREKYYVAIAPLGQINPTKHTITYDGNGATGGNVPSPHEQYAGHRVYLKNSYDVVNFIYKDDHYYAGWSTAPDKSGTRYDYGFIMPDHDITAYATWATHALYAWMRSDDYYIIPSEYTTLKDISVLPRTEIKFYLKPDGFAWRDDKVPTALSLDMLFDLTIRTSTRGGSAIGSVLLEEDAQGVYISVIFAEYYVDNNFQLNIFPVIDGRRQDDYAFTITGTMIDDGRRPPVTTNPGGGSGSGSRGGGGGSGSGGGSVYSAPDTARVSTLGVQQPAAVSESRAVELVEKALPGAQNGVTTVRLTGAGEISLDALKAMVKAAGSTALKVNADSLNADKSVDVRLTFDPAKATKALNLYASTTSSQAQAVKAHLNKWFDNTVTVVAFAQKGALGMPVEVCVKVDEALALKDLQFYHYDRAANVYNRIAAPSYWVDRNGYVHFTTELGDNIIITDKAMTRKA